MFQVGATGLEEEEEEEDLLLCNRRINNGVMQTFLGNGSVNMFPRQ
jgi:hypothetical protein